MLLQVCSTPSTQSHSTMLVPNSSNPPKKALNPVTRNPKKDTEPQYLTELLGLQSRISHRAGERGHRTLEALRAHHLTPGSASVCPGSATIYKGFIADKVFCKHDIRV